VLRAWWAGLAGLLQNLMTELKNAQERAQLAEKMADLAKSQQSALETELKNAGLRFGEQVSATPECTVNAHSTQLG
jgi:hypothetical protein